MKSWVQVTWLCPGCTLQQVNYLSWEVMPWSILDLTPWIKEIMNKTNGTLQLCDSSTLSKLLSFIDQLASVYQNLISTLWQPERGTVGWTHSYNKLFMVLLQSDPEGLPLDVPLQKDHWLTNTTSENWGDTFTTESACNSRTGRTTTDKKVRRGEGRGGEG